MFSWRLQTPSLEFIRSPEIFKVVIHDPNLAGAITDAMYDGYTPVPGHTYGEEWRYYFDTPGEVTSVISRLREHSFVEDDPVKLARAHMLACLLSSIPEVKGYIDQQLREVGLH